MSIPTRNPSKRMEVFSCAVKSWQLEALHAEASKQDIKVSEVGRDAITMYLKAKGYEPTTFIEKLQDKIVEKSAPDEVEFELQ